MPLMSSSKKAIQLLTRQKCILDLYKLGTSLLKANVFFKKNIINGPFSVNNVRKYLKTKCLPQHNLDT